MFGYFWLPLGYFCPLNKYSCFALIKKRKILINALVPSDLGEVIVSAKYTSSFKVIGMFNTGFWDVREAANTYPNTTGLKISKVVEELKKIISVSYIQKMLILQKKAMDKNQNFKKITTPSPNIFKSIVY